MLNCAAHFRMRAHSERGISIVEVLIAILVLAVVSGGVGLAVTGAARQTVVANASKAQLAAATQVFESVKSNRDWMAACEASFHRSPTAPCVLTSMAGGISAATGAGLMKAPWLGSSCAGPAFGFRLVRVVALPRDSAEDGKGSLDADGVTPDYYRIQVAVDTPNACDRTRFGITAPSVLDSAVDQHGRVPTASLTVDVCSVLNQMDERMDLGNCTGGTMPQMQPCATSSAPLSAGCPAAWSFALAGDRSFATASDRASDLC